MLNVTLVAVGTLKEDYLRAAFAEYEKRLRAFCKLELVNVKEFKLPETPGAGEIAAALEEEGLPLPQLTVLTHWHWDHTFGIPNFGIIYTPNCQGEESRSRFLSIR